MDERRRQDKTLAVSRVTRLRSGKILGGSDEGREEGEAWEETERSMLESSRVRAVPRTKGKVVDGRLPSAYCLLRRRRREWLMARALELRV